MNTRLWRQRLLLVASLVGVVFAGDRLFSLVFDQLTIGSRARFSRIFAGGEECDIVVLGNSRGAHSFFAPQIQQLQGAKVLNLSFNGITTEIAEQLFYDLLAHSRAPKMLIVEVTNIEQSTKEGLVNIRPFVAHSPGLRSLYLREHPADVHGMDVSHLYRFNCIWFFRSLYYMNRDDQDWIMRSTISDDVVSATASEEPIRFSERPDFDRNCQALGRIVKRAQAENITVRLVVAPYLPEYRKNISDWMEVLARVRQECGQDLRIWDYSEALKEPHYFADRIHTNLDGALVFGRMLDADNFFSHPVIAEANVPVQSSVGTYSFDRNKPVDD